MIGRLVGKLVTDDVDGAIILDVAGVGYEVTVPLGAVGRARAASSTAPELVLFVHTHVREDSLDLYGFASETERRVFRLLIGVPNIGPKLALAVLSSLPPAELATAIQLNDLKRLNKIPGVGKKTAERLVLELKEKLSKLDLQRSPGSAPLNAAPGDRTKLLGALVNMGYKPGEAEAAVEKLSDRIGHDPISDLLREALASLSS
jgi:Holliday junction DNA helicase RuvA